MEALAWVIDWDGVGGLVEEARREAEWVPDGTEIDVRGLAGRRRLTGRGAVLSGQSRLGGDPLPGCG